ncbi:MAG: diaminopimelate decarboxylase [Clostridia bacterium]|nr:diaminopimelate decarboxylase [Clostridia bacterium]
MNQRDTLKVNNEGILEIGGIPADVLVKDYGTPLYVIDQTHVENMCKTFVDALNNNQINGMICYASKAFCNKYIYEVINKYNLGADVVSIGELYTALKANFPANKLIFHGNNKLEEEINFALDNKIKYFVIDSYYELELLDKLCQEKEYVQDVLIRVNPGVEAHTHHYIQTAKTDSKFGFSLDNGDCDLFIKRVKDCKNVNLVGLHCHIGSQIFESKSFEIAVDKMTDYYKKCNDEFNVKFSVLDVGGGFGIYYSHPDPKMTYNDYTNYVDVICNTLKRKVQQLNIQMPYLILEPGRSIIGEAGITLYKVGSVKSIKDVKNYIAIDGGMFDNPRFALYQAKYSVVAATKMNDVCTTKYSIAGKCCESGDLIAENVELPNMQSGDLVAVLSTGAYNYSMASNYNRNLIPAVVSVKNGVSRIVVKKQTLEDLIKNDV